MKIFTQTFKIFTLATALFGMSVGVMGQVATLPIINKTFEALPTPESGFSITKILSFYAKPNASLKFEGKNVTSSADTPTLLISIDSSPDKLTFSIQTANAGNPSGFSNAIFNIEESSDKTIWNLVKSLKSSDGDFPAVGTPGKFAEFKDFQLDKTTRHIRFVYASTEKGNIGLSNISITKSVPTSAETPTLAEGSVFVSNGQIVVKTETAGTLIEIYNMAGQRLVSQVAEAGRNPITLAKGQIYVVKIGNLVKKVVL